MKTFILLVCATLAAATGGPGARCRPAVTITETVVLSTITVARTLLHFYSLPPSFQGGILGVVQRKQN